MRASKKDILELAIEAENDNPPEELAITQVWEIETFYIPIFFQIKKQPLYPLN